MDVYLVICIIVIRLVSKNIYIIQFHCAVFKYRYVCCTVLFWCIAACSYLEQLITHYSLPTHYHSVIVKLVTVSEPSNDVMMMIASNNIYISRLMCVLRTDFVFNVRAWCIAISIRNPKSKTVLIFYSQKTINTLVKSQYISIHLVSFSRVKWQWITSILLLQNITIAQTYQISIHVDYMFSTCWYTLGTNTFSTCCNNPKKY